MTDLRNICPCLGQEVGNDYSIKVLNELIFKLTTEDVHQRNVRRALKSCQIVRRDLLPILIHSRDNLLLFNTTIQLLYNLSIPVECLLPMEVARQTLAGKTVAEEVSSFLEDIKDAFLDGRAISIILEIMRTIIKEEQKDNFKHIEKRETLNNCLLLMHNILHIPEILSEKPAITIKNCCSKQNQIIWNMFSQGLDKVMLTLMTCKHSRFWAATMIQLIAIVYKDQQIATLHKLFWLECSQTDSSEDNESNTSPHDEDSGCSPLTSAEPSSDSSDTANYSKKAPQNDTRKVGASLYGEQHGHSLKNEPSTQLSLQQHQRNKTLVKQLHERAHTNMIVKNSEDDSRKHKTITSTSDIGGNNSGNSTCTVSDSGYTTQEAHESISSNDDECQNPNFNKAAGITQRLNKTVKQKAASGALMKRRSTPFCSTITDKYETKKRKLALKQRSHNVTHNKAWKLRMRGLKHKPTDDDISDLLKDFTVEFLLRGYSALVVDLKELMVLSNCNQLDKSHFLWLVTYFLKFACQLEIDFQILGPILSCDIISYITYEGVNTCEQLELVCRKKYSDLKPHLRRIHLIVTAIREFIQTLDYYNSSVVLSSEDRTRLQTIQYQICHLQDLRQLLLLLIRYYNPIIQSRQYLQDLIITNHIFIQFCEGTWISNKNERNLNLLCHLKQFATTRIMKQYGRALEDFQTNGNFVNDCIFTMMHHVAGDLESPETLFHPTILKCFSKMWETDYDLMDDWIDVMEYVINKFMTNTQSIRCHQESSSENIKYDGVQQNSKDILEGEDASDLYFYYIQCELDPDPFGKMIELYSENGISKTRHEIIVQLQEGNQRKEREHLSATETLKESAHLSKGGGLSNDISKIIGTLLRDDNRSHLQWLQQLLLEVCYLKSGRYKHVGKVLLPVEPVVFYYSVKRQSIPIIPFNDEQEEALFSESYIQLLHKLGFHLPEDVGKTFPRIPCFWTVDILLSVVKKLGPLSPDMIKFDIHDLCKSNDSSDDQILHIPCTSGEKDFE